MKHTYHFVSDPGHGYLSVPLADIKELGVAHLISGFSYQNGGIAYLEEDCDASVFLKAYEAKFGKKANIVETYTNNRASCRSYNRYQTTPDHDPKGYIAYLYK